MQNGPNNQPTYQPGQEDDQGFFTAAAGARQANRPQLQPPYMNPPEAQKNPGDLFQQPENRQPAGQAPAGRQPSNQPPFLSTPMGQDMYVDDTEDGFFTPAQGRRANPLRRQGPPVVEGSINPPFSSFPEPPRDSDFAPKGKKAKGKEAPPDARVPYQAPPRRRSLMAYLYMGLAVLTIVLAVMGVTQLMNRQGAMTAYVTISEQGSTYAGDALIVRNESVYSQEGVGGIRHIAREGSTVTRGDPVCVSYTTGYSVKERKNLDAAREQLKLHQQVLLSSAVSPDTKLARLDSALVERAAETQALVRGVKGNLLNQEELLRQAVEARQSYIKQKYPDDTKLTRLYDNENSQLQRIDTWKKQYAAMDNGLISFYTDGFEGALNTSNFQNYDPQQARKMLRGDVPEAFKPSENSQDIYRLVRQYEWSVLMLSDNKEWTPVAGDTYQMLIESFENTVVEATVDSVTRSGGDLLVRLTVHAPIDPVLYIRTCHVQLSKNVITYAVPANALMEHGGMIGVVARFKDGEYMIPVTVVSKDATQAHILPFNQGYLFEGMSVRLFNK